VTDLEAGFVALLTPASDPAVRQRQQDAATELLARWREPHRRYHTVDHLVAVLGALDRLTSPGGRPGALDEVPLRLAAWFHDAVYAGRPGADEEASATLAEQVLGGLGEDADRVAEVGRLVRVTAAHTPDPGDAAAVLLVDADLAVLGGPDADYRAYADAVRQEYAQVPEPLFRAARAQVLRRLTSAEQIYATPRARLLWEAAARANVAAEIARLEGV
jgi:predicted metal-dependent HD superfamily phosphohydrolase